MSPEPCTAQFCNIFAYQERSLLNLKLRALSPDPRARGALSPACLPQVCNIFAYQDRNFLCAGVPVHRMHVHVRRLVTAGHKVGIVRQTETKAIKASEGKGAKTFQRELTALYTASTLEVTPQPAGPRAQGAGFRALVMPASMISSMSLEISRFTAPS